MTLGRSSDTIFRVTVGTCNGLVSFARDASAIPCGGCARLIAGGFGLGCRRSGRSAHFTLFECFAHVVSAFMVESPLEGVFVCEVEEQNRELEDSKGSEHCG